MHTRKLSNVAIETQCCLQIIRIDFTCICRFPIRWWSHTYTKLRKLQVATDGGFHIESYQEHWLSLEPQPPLEEERAALMAEAASVFQLHRSIHTKPNLQRKYSMPNPIYTYLGAALSAAAGVLCPKFLTQKSPQPKNSMQNFESTKTYLGEHDLRHAKRVAEHSLAGALRSTAGENEEKPSDFAANILMVFVTSRRLRLCSWRKARRRWLIRRRPSRSSIPRRR